VTALVTSSTVLIANPSSGWKFVEGVLPVRSLQLGLMPGIA